MKSQHPNDPFDTLCWMYQLAADPYQVLAYCFAEAHVHAFRRLVKKLMKHAAGASAYTREPPEDVLLSMKLIRSLIKAAHILQHKKNSPVVVDESDLFNKKYYLSHYVSADPWKEFPRHLSKREYCNPYLVFEAFFRYQPLTHWVQRWEQIVKSALDKDSGLVPAAPLKLRTHLLKLVEAAHLVTVREARMGHRL